MPKNTRVTYRYRDAGNNKVSETVVFGGQPTDALVEDIVAHLTAPCGDELGGFVPGLVGLRDMQNKFFEKHIALTEALTGGDAKRPMKSSASDELILEEMQALADEMKTIKPIWWPDDTTSHELLSVEATDDPQTDPRSIDTFAADMIAADWDSDYLPPFHAEMVANYEEHLHKIDSDTPAP